MRKTLKFFIAIIGAIDVVFSIFLPISLSLILVNLLTLNNFHTFIVLFIGIASSYYRAIRIGFLE